MKSVGSFLVLWLTVGQAVAHAEAASLAGSAGSSAYVLARTEQFVLRSAEKRSYLISIARPEAPSPAAGYPVIYVLDPASAFATLVETVRNQEIYLGPVVVVGVGYPPDAADGERIRDMTPGTDRSMLPKDNFGKPWGAIGGADAFLRFMLDKLKPAVEMRLPIDRGRQALFGHSLGGLFALHTLFTRPEAFQTYVAGSPSIWWGGKSILAEAKTYKARQLRGPPRRLLITVGGFESEVRPEEEDALIRTTKPADPEQMKRRYHEYVARIAPVASCRELFELLNEPPTAGLEVRYVEFPDETHNSVIPAYLSRGASFVLAPRH